MRIPAVLLAGALGFAASAVSANAAPVVPAPATQAGTNIIEIAQGCGRGFHRDRWGHCVPHRYRSARPHHYRYSYRAPSYRYRYSYPRSWHPSDNVANQLNARELRRFFYGGGTYHYPGYGWGY